MRPRLKLTTDHPLLRFALGVAIFTPLTMALWWFVASDYLVDPFVRAFAWLPRWIFGENVIELRPVQTSWGSWEAVTNLSPQDQPISLITFVIPIHRLSVGFAVFWAFQLATPLPHRWRKLTFGTLVLLPVFMVLVIMYVQSNFVSYVNEGTRLLRGTPVLALPYSSVVYYLSHLGGRHLDLLLPLVLPVFVWAALNRAMFTPRRPSSEAPSAKRNRKRKSKSRAE